MGDSGGATRYTARVVRVLILSLLGIWGGHSSIFSAVISEDPPLDQAGALVGNFVVPILWGIQAVGADLAKEDLQEFPRTPVNVVVSDAGVKVGAHSQITAPGEARKPKTLSLRITANTGVTKKIPYLDRVIEAWNRIFPNEVPDPRSRVRYEESHHASHVAGIVGALNPTFGVSPYASIIDMDIFKGTNLFASEVLAGGLNAILSGSEKIDVINMSHYIPTTADVQSALHKLKNERDVLLVAAAGNEGEYIDSSHPLYRAPNLIVVGALGVSGSLAQFSNFGGSLDIVAPGEMIISRGSSMKWRNESLQTMSGTSMATPFVSGSLATLRALLPSARSDDLKTIIYRSALDLGRSGKDFWYGHGLLNQVRAVNVATRLIRGGLTSQDAITQAVTVDDTFNFKELSRQAKIEMAKAGLGSSEAEQWARRSVLLDGGPEALASLGVYYQITGDDTRAFAWLYSAYNSESMTATPEEYAAVAKTLWQVQSDRMMAFKDGLSLINNLSNVDFAVSAYQVAPDAAASVMTPFFIKKVASLDISRVKDLGQIIAQRKLGPSAGDLIASLSTGH